ncbi:lysozyme-like domain-containing protein [Mycena capillaripes]|nr:lysozyme-like domain-containing protein [Mycena capillaripes]
MLLALPFVILSAALAVHANIAHGAHVARHHPRISIPKAPLESNLRKRKSCNPRAPKSVSKSASSSHHSTSTKKALAAPATSTKKTTAAAKPTSLNNVAIAGTVKVVVNRCGPSGATTKVTSTTGPNGDIDWLNCGLTGSGWNPPNLHVSDIIAADLKTALKDPNSPFKACSPYVDYFYQYADQFGLKPIMLAAFAMQESSCNSETVGGGGEQGLMQLTQDKCGGAPGGNCRTPWFNIMTGAKYFSQTLSNNGGNVLLSIGEYNGWTPGLTKAKATAARYSDCCLCQNNMDYLHQYMNGWLQNINAYADGLGKYHNLDVCPGKD